MLRKKYIAITVVLIGLVIVSSQFFTNLNYTSNTKEVYVSIDKGSGLKSISRTLKNKGVISSSTYFILYSKLKGIGQNLKYGNYILPPRIGLDLLLQQLQNPKRDYVVVTFPEGSNLYQIAKKLEANNLADSEKLLDMKVEELDSDISVVDSTDKYYSLEGYLFPDTYYIPVEFTEKDIARMMFNQLQRVLKEEYYSRAAEIGLSIDKVLTIASLIEKEAANDKERSRISGVIYNRLKKGMPLQIDASVIYGITKGEKNITRVTYNDLKSNSEYNTYQNTGIPPGPIASPGRASIEAALYPEEHNYLYYVLGDEGHVFSETYEGHLKNVKKYIK